jgi:subtilisin family serine protease
MPKVAAAVASGVFFSISAGNSNTDASSASPASEVTACTVGASDINDAKASFSNYGPIVDVWAPGVNVLSTWIGGSTNTISGTSMAAPHITGLGAYLLALEGSGTEGLCERIIELAVKDTLTGLPSGTANQLAFNGAPVS